ncbi:MAG: class I SAM-dependent methyltransferase [Gemmatimonadetes bacterium]|nr:class I SAM-dependent methyltransferase [Gemmatimonadota bacterium]NNM03698.1 class I SAM-dependent methyltransferase [Gemmatimonadota bacterium]
MDPEYGQIYRTLYEEHWWWRARERIVLKEIHDLNPTDSWGSILDVGCGDGLFFPKLQALGEVEGVEPDASLVSQASLNRWNIHLRPFDSSFRGEEPFRLILFLDVLEHMQEPEPALAHALDLLEPGGIILVTVPAFPVLWTSHDEANHHFRRYTISSFRDLAGSVGMRVYRQRYFFHWLFGPKLVQRLFERTFPGDRELRNPRIPRAWANRLIEGFSVMENAALGPLRVPLGSSLLVVGTKG